MMLSSYSFALMLVLLKNFCSPTYESPCLFLLVPLCLEHELPVSLNIENCMLF